MNPEKPQATRLPVTPALAAALVLLLSVAAAAFYFQQRAEEAIGWRKHTSEVRVEISNLQNDLTKFARGQRGYAIAGKQEWLDPYHEARKDAPERLRKLKILTADNPVQQRALDQLNEQMDVWFAFASKGLALVPDKGLEALRQHIAGGAGRTELDKMEEVLHGMDDEEERLFKIRDASASRNTRLASGITMLGSLLALGLMAWSGLALNRTIAQLREAAAKTAAEDWAKTGLVKVTRLLQGERDPDKAAQALLSELAPYLGAQHAVFYAPEGEFTATADGPPLRLRASYAYRERKHLAAPGSAPARGSSASAPSSASGSSSSRPRRTTSASPPVWARAPRWTWWCYRSSPGRGSWACWSWRACSASPPPARLPRSVDREPRRPFQLHGRQPAGGRVARAERGAHAGAAGA